MSEEVHIGPAIRMIMESHQKDKPITKVLIKQAFKIKDINKFLDDVNEKLMKYKLELIGVSKEKTSESYKSSEKIFIIEKKRLDKKAFENVGNALTQNEKNYSSKRNSTQTSNTLVNETVKNDDLVFGSTFFKYITIFTIIHLEGGNVEIETFKKLLEETELFFDDKDILEHLNTTKTKGYIIFIKEEDDTYVTFGWRFYVEFPRFNPSRIFKHIEIFSRLKYHTAG